jgi:hypothetical protein
MIKNGSNLLSRHHSVSLLLLDAALAVRAVQSLASLGAALVLSGHAASLTPY